MENVSIAMTSWFNNVSGGPRIVKPHLRTKALTWKLLSRTISIMTDVKRSMYVPESPSVVIVKVVHTTERVRIFRRCYSEEHPPEQ